MTDPIDIKALGKVAVLMGGTAAEREVSLKSGKAVLDALVSQGVDAEGIDVVSVEQLLDIAKRYDRVFNVVHGRWGKMAVFRQCWMRWMYPIPVVKWRRQL